MNDPPAPSPGPDAAALVDTARRWASADPDPLTRRVLLDAAEGGDHTLLAELVGQHLVFGTAGVRAPLGAGSARMNRAVVRRVAAALAIDLIEGHEPWHTTISRGPDVVVGHDARHGSARFARDVTQVLVAHGLRVATIDEAAPTPLVVWALTASGARAAVVVTASHNPAGDNGLKVYAADGAQIVPPTDARIADRLAHMAPDADPLRAGESTAGSSKSLGGPSSDDRLVLGYLDRVVAPARDGLGPMRVVHTSLHGVGHVLAERALARVRGVQAVAVTDQAVPDPDFPTVRSPNPEEPGTLAHLIELAERERADVALALDPDADRLAVALPEARDEATGWRQLTGDELGALLADDLLVHVAPTVSEPLVVTTVVSSRLVPAMCAAAGVHHAETLTGFKWLCRPALAHPERHQLLAYEEALGYAIGPDARDKDGIAAAIATLCAWDRLRARGTTAWQRLDDLARAHGAHVTHNGSLALRDRVDPTEALERTASLRALGGTAVVAVDRLAPDVVRLLLEDRTRVVVRPSGTEPKLKIYVEAITPVEAGASVTAARAAAGEVAAGVAAALQSLLGDAADTGHG